ncbi:PIR Superfamily Protein [Plasmodium ovale wallikeri]|uniref:PIR Superfamily Protein n=1 Tax=Plasmodium ovale wallikeri TaxID=864142 RepID=A0A1A9AG27_PLAOA|nr:PIR Superfamily Protein [Plasmodium ovale wallikeri]SBT55957.1 PIR Superfamily Protein [Plasmodium ovale wallikeri]
MCTLQVLVLSQINKDSIKNNDIEEINKTWKMQINDSFSFFYIPCKFHSKTLKDVKIIKVLFYHILFFNNTEDKYNLNKEIETCDFCKHLKASLNYFVETGKSTCSTESP